MCSALSPAKFCFDAKKDGISGGYFQPEKRELNLVQEILLNYSNFLLHVIKDTNQKLFDKKIQIYVSIASIFTPNHSRVLI